jgi:glycosyltransferase involved in cell wall biosynthesis
MPNICCFTRITFAHDVKGGMETQTAELARGLVRRGHRVTILTTSLRPGHGETREEDGVSVQYLAVSKPGRYSEEFWQRSLRRFEELHRKAPFDIVWGVGIGAQRYLKTYRRHSPAPVISFVQCCFIDNLQTLTSRLLLGRKYGSLTYGQYLYNMKNNLSMYLKGFLPVYHLSDLIISPSPQNTRHIRIESLLPRSKLMTSVNGIDTDVFRPDDTLRKQGRIRLKVQDNEAALLTVGRIVPEKGAQVLIEALRICGPQIGPFKAFIIGSGEYRGELEKKAAECGLGERVIFPGVVENHELPAYYNAADIAVCPTLLVESYGISNAEAMACGTPVISSAIGGTRYVVEHDRSGILFPPGKPRRLAQAILRICGDRGLALSLGKAARARAERHLSSRRMIDDFEKAIDDVLRRRKRR